MAKIKCPYKYPARSREAKVNYICGIGGYSNRDGRWPIEFNVALYDVDFDFDHLWKKYHAEMTPDELKHDPELCSLYYRLAQRLYEDNKDFLWEWGQEDAGRNLTDCDTYKQLWDGTEVDVEFSLRGRCGKHLVLDRFRSLSLDKMDEEELRTMLTEQSTRSDTYVYANRLLRGAEWTYSNEFVDTLYRYVRQCEVDFTPEKASAEVEYQGAFCFFFNIVASAWEEEKQNKADHEAVVGCAQTLRRYLAEREGSAVLQMLRTLSQAAGVSEEELWQGE